MKYELSVLHRITLYGVLQKVGGPGSALYQHELRQLRERVSISEAEANTINLMVGLTAEEQKAHDDPGISPELRTGLERLKNSYRWDGEKARVISVNIGDRLADQIRAVLKDLDKAEQLMPEHMAVYDMFLPPEEPKAEEPLGVEERPLT